LPPGLGSNDRGTAALFSAHIGRAGMRLGCSGDSLMTRGSEDAERAGAPGIARSISDRFSSGHDRFAGGAFSVRASHEEFLCSSYCMSCMLFETQPAAVGCHSCYLVQQTAMNLSFQQLSYDIQTKHAVISSPTCHTVVPEALLSGRGVQTMSAMHMHA
jgi:hypothetical protein